MAILTAVTTVAIVLGLRWLDAMARSVGPTGRESLHLKDAGPGSRIWM